ncbi:MAG: porin family protein [Ignavibacteria bacterium]|nr:porin family protein [Ignavibacteria bacterium]
MKTLTIILFVFLFFLVTNSSVAQFGRSSFAFNIGAYVPTGKIDGYNYKVGFNLGAEYEDCIYPAALFVNATFNMTRLKFTDNASRYVVSSNSSLFELTGGARYYLSKGKVKPFADVSLGVYVNNRSAYSDSLFKYDSDTQTRMGGNTGIGVAIFLNPNLDLLLKTKFHFFFVNRDGVDVNNYAGFYAGLKYSF